MNKGIRQIRTESVQRLRKTRNIPVTEIRQALFVQTAKPHNLTATVVVGRKGGPRSLRRYGAKAVGRRGRGVRQPNSPVFVAVVPGQRKMVRGAFTRRSDNAVFKRVGAGRYPLEFLFGPSLWTAYENNRMIRALRNFARDRVPPLVEYELRRELRKSARRAVRGGRRRRR